MEFIKKEPKIFILSGKARSGKNVVASLIKNHYEVLGKKCVVISFAKYLKDYAKEILGWDGDESTKPRDFLQQIGVELIKNKISANMLINRVREDIEVYSYFYDVIIVSDARFIDEIEVVSDRIVIKVVGNSSDLTIEQASHITEHGLDLYDKYDYVINNNGSIEDLKNDVEKVLEVIL